jgi:hypothetical protein
VMYSCNSALHFCTNNGGSKVLFFSSVSERLGIMKLLLNSKQSLSVRHAAAVK